MRSMRALNLIFILFLCVWPIQCEIGFAEAAKQPLPSCCGANSLYVLFHMLGGNINLGDIIEHRIVSEKSPNLSLLDLKTVAADFGYKMEPCQVSCDKLVNLKLPFIAHIAQNLAKQAKGHFVVGWSKNLAEAEIVDYPGHGIVPWEKLKQHFTGYALILSAERNSVSSQKGVNSPYRGEVDNAQSTLLSKGPTALPEFAWVGENSIDAGVLFEGSDPITKYEFCFKNAGGKTLLINDFMASCSCAEAKLSMHSIPPGQSGKLAVKLEKKVEGPFTEYVRLNTNDPCNPISYATI